MTLYEINQALTECMKIDAETGEITLDETLYNQLDMLRNDKLESIACWVKNLTAESKAIADEAKALTISIHALRAEGDLPEFNREIHVIISIHALRAEGDGIMPEYITQQ